LEAYHTPQALWRAYQTCIRTALAEGADAVAAGNGMLMRLPGIGPDTSRSVYTNLMANGWNLAT
jgi:hypothetical protein